MAGKKVKQAEKRSVIVTTEHRGVFFGYLENPSPNATEVTLEGAVMVIYFGTTQGLGQLAATGPTDKTRLAARVPKWHLRKVTSIMECSGEAQIAFLKRISGGAQ
jgi:hypothetical protein